MVTALLLLALSQDGGGFTVKVTVEDIGEVKGKLFSLLFDKAEPFPTKPDQAIKKAIVTVTAKSATFTFEGVAPGTYAVSVFQDVNDNGKMDTNFIGIPKEPVGVSNDAKGRMGPPKFEDAKFKLDGDKALTIHLR